MNVGESKVGKSLQFDYKIFKIMYCSEGHYPSKGSEKDDYPEV